MTSDQSGSGADTSWLNEIAWQADGLVPAVAQDADNGRVLMVAWMNREALMRTVASGEAHYWSRSRNRLWHKGEESGNLQKVREVRLDCDADVVLVMVEQQGGIACHTGRERCFFRRFDSGRWAITDEVLRDPQEIYRK